MNIPPLWLYAQELAAKTWARIRPPDPPSWNGLPKTNARGKTLIGHQRFWNNMLDEANIPLDNDNRHWSGVWGDIPISLETVANVYQYAGYTDGSKFDDGRSGAAWIITEDNYMLKHRNYHLGRTTSVFQAETMALLRLADYLIAWAYWYKDTGITIYSDSRSVLQALMNSEGNSCLLRDCRKAFLKLVDMGVKFQLSWIKGHKDFTGNEVSDFYARQASDNNTEFLVEVPVPRAFVKRQIHDLFSKYWDTLWKSLPNCRQSKSFIPSVPHRMVGANVLSRKEMRTIAFIITGHAFVSYHRFKQGQTDSAVCRLCDHNEETTWHLLFDCPAFAQTRAISPIMNGVQHQQIGQDGQPDLIIAILEMCHNKMFNGLITKYDRSGMDINGSVNNSMSTVNMEVVNTPMDI